MDAPDDSPASARQALLESVDGCPLGTTLPRQSEASPSRLPSLAGRGPAEGILPLRGPNRTPWWRSGARAGVWWTVLWETQWGQSDGRQGPVVASLQGPGRSGASAPHQRTALPRSGGVTPRSRPRASKIVTWLILPVVICLSQRLSHACLSISNLYRETANGSLNQLSFI